MFKRSHIGLFAFAATAACADASPPLASSIDVIVGPPAALEVGGTLSAIPTIEIRNSDGRAMRNIPLTITPEQRSGTLTGAPTKSLAGPTPIGTWTLDTIAGTQSLRIESPRLPALSIAITATPGAVASLTVIEGNRQSASENTAVRVPIRVRVRDQYENNIPRVAVAWSIAAGGGRLAAPVSVTDENGVAIAPAWTVGADGSGLQRLAASVGELTSEITAMVQEPPAEITIESNAPSAVRLGSSLSPTFLVRAADGNAVVGVPVTIAVTAGGGQLVNSPTESGEQPMSIGTWTVGSNFGLQAVTVSVAGVPSAIITTDAISEYVLEVRWNGAPPTGAVQVAFDNAVTRLRSIIVGPQSDITFTNFDADGCVTGLTLNETIPGLLVFATIAPIDGAGGTWGFAGPCYIRQDNALTAVGHMRFDSADLPSLEANGTLASLILHEMLHVIGIGTLWNIKGLQTGSAPNSTPVFTGVLARDACVTEHAGTAVCGGGVRIEDCLNLSFACGAGTINTHWKESVFRNELMTGFLSTGVNPLSKMTIQSLADLDYEVHTSVSDPYAVPPPALMSPTSASSLRLPRPHGPVAEVNASGQITRSFAPMPRDH